MFIVRCAVYRLFEKENDWAVCKRLCARGSRKKQGTPTTGGVFIVLAIIVASIITLLLAQRFTTEAIIVLITLVFYTFAGFQDDYLKIKGKANDGLSAKGKLMRQIAIALLPTIYVMMTYSHGAEVTICSHVINLKWFYPLFAVFVITGASNAYNLTDGLDGLAASTGILHLLLLLLLLCSADIRKLQ